MHASIKGTLEDFEDRWACFEHRGKKVSKANVMKVLQYALTQGYETTEQLSDEEVDRAISEPTPAPPDLKAVTIIHDTLGGGSRVYAGAEYVKVGGLYGWLFVDGMQVKFAYAYQGVACCDVLPNYRVTYTISAQ